MVLQNGNSLLTGAESRVTLNVMLQAFYVWCQRNQLTVHTGKTAAMYISCSPFIGPLRKIKFGEDTIEFKQDSKCLGVVIDNRLSWKPQVEAVCKKFLGKFRFLRRLKSLPTRTQEDIYYKGAISSVTYCIAVWGTTSAPVFNQLEKLHCKAAKLIYRLPSSTPDHEALQNANWMPISYIYKRRMAAIMYNAKSKTLPESTLTLFETNENPKKAFDTIEHEIFLQKMKHIGFADSALYWLKSYLTNRTFFVNVGKESSLPGNLSCGVPQGSILGPLIFLLYVNDMPQAVDCDLLLYADDSCLVFSDKSISDIEEQLNKNFNSLCDWFVDNKLSIHFGEDKTKSILFGKTNKKSGNKKLDIRRGDIKIKQHTSVTYLGCILDESLSGESMATRILGKINGRLRFLYRKQNFLDFPLRRLLANALIQPHFDYACSAWFPLINKRLTRRIQTAQNKCVRFCLNMNNRAHIGVREFKNINWLPTKERFEQCTATSVFKFSITRPHPICRRCSYQLAKAGLLEDQKTN